VYRLVDREVVEECHILVGRFLGSVVQHQHPVQGQMFQNLVQNKVLVVPLALEMSDPAPLPPGLAPLGSVGPSQMPPTSQERD